MKVALALLSIMTISLTAFASATYAIEQISGQNLENKLKPFSTDGCSKFPDGIPYFNATKWRNCCIEHDIAYWQGGTKEQRKRADESLSQCVVGTGEYAIGKAMYYGVRIGGYVGFPTSWHWGYGWTMSRDYSVLRPEEQLQVDTLIKNIPQKLSNLAIQSPPAIRERSTLTGNKCLDVAVMQIESDLRRPFKIESLQEFDQRNSTGLLKTLSVKVESCSEPYRFQFQLLRDDACIDNMNELLARGRIRLMSASSPRSSCK